MAFFLCAFLSAAIFNSGCIKQCSPLSNDSIPSINDSLPDTDTTDIPPTDTTKTPPVDSTTTPPTDTTKLDSVQATIFGHWLGTYYDSNHQNPLEYDMYINEDFTMTFSSDADGFTNTGGGSWALKGTTFSADITTKTGKPYDIGVEQVLSANYDGYNQTFTNGTWKNITVHDGSGYFEMKKID